MLLARLGRALLVLALLFAQQAAVAHSVWHAAAAAKAGAVHLGAKGNPLCAQHGSLDTVLGGVSAAVALAFGAEPQAVHFPAADLPTAKISGPSPVSRGPPAVL